MAYDDLINNYAQPAINLWSGIQGMNNAGNTNSQVQSMLGQNQSTTSNAIASLQQQIAASQAAAKQQYETAQGQVGTQNAALGSQADSLAQQLAALSDPNSAYMQNARSAIERKDAAAGRRSQWGDREVQLQGTLADYVGKYAPGLNNSITSARNQISQNNQGLASLFANANAVPDRNMASLVQLLQNQLQGANAVNTTGRQAANSATNNTTGLLTNGAKLLSNLFGNGSSSNYGLSDTFNWGSNPSGVLNGLTGGGSTDLFGTGGYFNNPTYGTTSGTGDPYSDWGGGGLSDNSLWDF